MWTSRYLASQLRLSDSGIVLLGQGVGVEFVLREHDALNRDPGGCATDVDPIPVGTDVPLQGCIPTQWTIIIPFFNEANFIARTLRSTARQNLPFDLILVDNGSTDESCTVVRTECERLGLDHLLLTEPRPGKVHALAAGLSRVRTDFVATFDADTAYPPAYLRTARRLFENESTAAAQAYYVRPGWQAWRRSIAAAKLTAATWLLPHQCHNGGAGQVFRTEALRRSGGFDPLRWDLILEDHEIIHRISQLGKVSCAHDFCCSPDRRERDRPSTRWSFFERIAYHLTPSQFQPLFYYRFLGPRLEARQQSTVAMRDQRA